MKQALILLHGAISSKKQFDPLLPFIDDQFEVHALNFPGHGGSEIPAEPFSIPMFASSVLDYLDREKISAASIFGYSMGGYAGLYLAAHYPQRVKKLFTLATKLEWTEQIAEKETAQLNPAKISEKVPAFAKYLAQTHYPQDWQKVLQKTSGMLLHLGKYPVLSKKDFQQIKIPVIIGLGELDKMVSVDESENATGHLENGQLLMLPSTPHPFEKVNHHSLSGYMNSFFSG
ncbi:MAG TPA: alpha/beta fold hydrolase [Bacteroidia bacterium]|nr:alpha/beta fold hydrolase [Bacteroidia bacterium]